MVATYNIEQVSFDKENLILKINAKIFNIPLNKVSSRLVQATEFQRQFYKISPSGYGIHWPLIDEDLSVEALIKNSSVV
jgi:hypothetical protein